MHFLLFYTYVPDILERRAQFRGAHIKLAWAAQQRGELMLGGALTDPVDMGVLLFSVPSKDVVEKFVAEDPYVQGGLVTQWSIRNWMTVVGDGATNPIRPDA
ncbi:MAG: YciI-like protein [Pseudomonadota bacterium]